MHKKVITKIKTNPRITLRSLKNLLKQTTKDYPISEQAKPIITVSNPKAAIDNIIVAKILKTAKLRAKKETLAKLLITVKADRIDPFKNLRNSEVKRDFGRVTYSEKEIPD